LEVGRELVLLARRQRLGPDLEALVALARRLAPPLDDRVGVADLRGLLADARERDVVRGLERDLCAALEVDPQVQAADAERDAADEDDRTRDREPEVAPAHEVDLQPLRALLPCSAH